MAALVTVSEFSTFLGIAEPTGIKLAQMTQFLSDASDWAREISRRAWVLPADAPVTVKGIIKAACRREWNNPKRVASLVKGPQAVTLDTKAYPAEFFTEAEERRLESYSTVSGDLWVQETYREEPELMNGYLEVYPHGGFMPVHPPFDEVGYPGSIHF